MKLNQRHFLCKYVGAITFQLKRLKCGFNVFG